LALPSPTTAAAPFHDTGSLQPVVIVGKSNAVARSWTIQREGDGEPACGGLAICRLMMLIGGRGYEGRVIRQL
ncbi:hypothetical protein, partial [Mesorhizobium sp. M5C.F.Cr.IN.023.01.1.1]|uniref:hypothetical protein n=1 Tax=Mesorhizobium sp. M5C.F.Cr.IN.023.01.1.1 TaxID=2496768 RepID=UPI0019D137CF